MPSRRLFRLAVTGIGLAVALAGCRSAATSSPSGSGGSSPGTGRSGSGGTSSGGTTGLGGKSSGGTTGPGAGGSSDNSGTSAGSGGASGLSGGNIGSGAGGSIAGSEGGTPFGAGGIIGGSSMTGSGGKGGAAGGAAGGPIGGGGGLGGSAGSQVDSGGVGGAGGSSTGLGDAAPGPMVVPLGSNCGEGKLAGQIVAAQSPVVLAARLTDVAALNNNSLTIVPASATDTAYISSYYADHLAKVAPLGVSIEPTGVCGFAVQLVVDGADSPALFANTQDSTMHSVFDRFYSLWTPEQPTWSADYVAKASVSVVGYGTVDGDLGVGAIIDGSGKPHTIVTNSASSGLKLYDRLAPGMWKSSSTVTSYGQNPKAVIDLLGRLRIVYSFLGSDSYYHFSEWTDGKTLTDFRKDPRYGASATAAGPSGMLGVVRVTANGIAVTYSDGVTIGDDHLVPATTPTPNGDPCYTKASTCMPLVCETEGVAFDSVALSSTSDGTMWLTYRHVHYTDEYTVDGINTQDCWKLSKESATADVVLVRLAADGSATQSSRWSYSRSGSSVDVRPVAMAARGSRLFLAIPDNESVDVLVLDTTKL